MKIITCAVILLTKLTGTSVTAVHCEGDYVPSYFESATKSPYFVDKSLLLQTFLNGTPKVLITCPRGFGKTVNLDMLRRFFQITVNGKTGQKIDKKTSRSYKLFTDKTLNLQIAHDTDFVQRHLGEYIVVYLTFTHIQGTTSVEVRDSIREKVRALLTSYHWLYKLMEKKYRNEQLDRHQTDLQQYRKILHHKGNEMDTIQGLKVLLQYLRDTYESPLIALIDDYDVPIRHAINNGINADEINKFVLSIVGVFVTITRFADYTVAAGVMRLFHDDQCAGRIEDLYHHHFTYNRTFAEYFGFTESQVQRSLAVKNISDVQQKINLKKYLNGYRIPESTIPLYHPKGTRHYLDTDTIHRHADDDIIAKFFKCLRHPKFFQQLSKIYTDDKIPISVNFHVDKQDLAVFIQMVRDNCTAYAESAQYFAPFVDHGYLTYADDLRHLEIPNKIAEEKLKLEFQHFYLETYGINVTHPQILASLDILLSSKHSTTTMTNKFAHFLQLQLQPVANTSLDEFQFQSIIFAIVYSNAHTVAKTKLRLAGSTKESHFEGIDKMKIISKNQKVLIIIKVTFRGSLEEAMREAGTYLPIDSATASSLFLIKYLGINMNAQNQIEIGIR